MTPEILTLLALLAVAVALFASEVVPIDVAGVALLLGLFATGLIDAEDVSHGFGNQVILFLGSLFVVTAGLVKTGALDLAERALAGLAERRPRLLVALLVSGVGAVSAFLSNTATTAAFLPLAVALARRLRTAPSKLLMPLAFGSILGGTSTLIGTSTNIVVSGMLPRFGLAPLSLFELAPVGLPILVLGLGYLLTAGHRLLPEHRDEPLDVYGVRSYLAEVSVPPTSPWVGRTLDETGAGRDLDITVLGVIQADHRVVPLPAERRLAAGDLLLVEAPQERLLSLVHRRELELTAGRRSLRPAGPVPVHELLLSPGSRLIGKSLRQLQFRTRYDLTVLAVYRHGRSRRARLGDTTLRGGDLLLVQGGLDRLAFQLRAGEVIVLDRLEVRPRGRRAGLAVGLFAAMIVVGGLGWAPFAIAALGAAGGMVVFGCVSSAEAYAAVEWRILIMVGCLLAFATAMESSGTAAYLAERIAELARGWGPMALLGGFYLLTLLLTQPMSNQASALVVLPVALRTAVEMGLDPRAFAVTVCLAASCSFITPLEPASLLVYGPGRYRFRDFFVVGLPLTALVLAVTLLLVPRIWPL